MTAELPTADREALVAETERHLPVSSGSDQVDRGNAVAIVDALLPHLAVLLDRARQQGRDEVLADKPQRQCSVTDQLIELHNIAVREGLYDADDWLMTRLARGSQAAPSATESAETGGGA